MRSKNFGKCHRTTQPLPPDSDRAPLEKLFPFRTRQCISHENECARLKTAPKGEQCVVTEPEETISGGTGTQPGYRAILALGGAAPRAGERRVRGSGRLSGNSTGLLLGPDRVEQGVTGLKILPERGGEKEAVFQNH